MGNKRLRMETRSRKRFALESAEGVLVFLASLITWPISKPWLKNLGSTRLEREQEWPGDDLTVNPRHCYTRGIKIHAPPTIVWEWLVQFGLGRAGFYSYELLEKLAGIPVVNVESIVQNWQSLNIGDEIKLHPKAPGIPVAYVSPERHVCFGVLPSTNTSDAERPDPARSWSMIIIPDNQGSCRLLLRGRVEALREPTLAKQLAGVIDAPIDFVMEQRMLRTIKRLAERTC